MVCRMYGDIDENGLARWFVLYCDQVRDTVDTLNYGRIFLKIKFVS